MGKQGQQRTGGYVCVVCVLCAGGEEEELNKPGAQAIDARERPCHSNSTDHRAFVRVCAAARGCWLYDSARAQPTRKVTGPARVAHSYGAATSVDDGLAKAQQRCLNTFSRTV